MVECKIINVLLSYPSVFVVRKDVFGVGSAGFDIGNLAPIFLDEVGVCNETSRYDDLHF